MPRILKPGTVLILFTLLLSCSKSGDLNLSLASTSSLSETEQKLAFTPTKGKIANNIQDKIPTADCKQINEAFYDAGDAVVEIMNYSKNNKQSLSPEQQEGLKTEAKRYMSIVTATRIEDKKRCA